MRVFFLLEFLLFRTIGNWLSCFPLSRICTHAFSLALSSPKEMRSTPASRSSAPRVVGSVDHHRRGGLRRIPAAEPPENGASQSQPRPPPPPSPPPVTSPTDLVAWGGRLPSRRRLLISGAASTSIILAGNFGGATSLLLSSTDAAAALARSLRLDVLFPVRGAKRALAPDGGGYEFVYPRSWLADQTVARRRAVAAELSR